MRPKDTSFNGIKTPERTGSTSTLGYMPPHPIPRTLKPLAVREVDGGVNLRYQKPCSGGDFCNRGARRACTFLFLCPTASRSLLPSPNNDISPYWLGAFRRTLMRAVHQSGRGCQWFG